MGLRLYVPPVESDLTSKPAEKNTTSPPRSRIHRSARQNPRERRATIRRNAALRERATGDPVRHSAFTPREGGADARVPPRVESGFLPGREQPSSSDPLSSRREEPFREALRELRSQERRRERIETQLNALLEQARNAAQTEREPNNERQEGTFGWEPFETHRRHRRPVVPPRVRGGYAVDAPGSGVIIAVTDQYIPTPPSPPVLDGPLRPSWVPNRRPFLPRPRALGMDGLGDRDRSVSPDVWDTLWSTLTPDPQPPSAGSSFASTAASQSAGVSSNTSLTEPDAQLVLIPDGPCDSDCENTDGEGPNVAPLYLARGRGLDEPMRRVRLRVPPSQADRFNGLLNPSPGSDDNLNPGRSNRPAPARTVDEHDLSSTTLRPQRGWVGHLSVGASDDERSGLNRRNSTASGNNASTGGAEDLADMQHIVRNLARREDIPDDWWTEAGLSRTLRRGESL